MRHATLLFMRLPIFLPKNVIDLLMCQSVFQCAYEMVFSDRSTAALSHFSVAVPRPFYVVNFSAFRTLEVLGNLQSSYLHLTPELGNVSLLSKKMFLMVQRLHDYGWERRHK